MTVTAARILSRRRAVILALPVLLTASAGCDVMTADLRHSETAEWRKTYDLAPTGRVEIANVNGRIVVQRSTNQSVEVVAIKTARGATPEAARENLGRIEIRDESSPQGVKVSTTFTRKGSWLQGGGEVAYTVKVPAAAEVHFSTVNGGLDLTGLSGRIVAETTNGGIVAREISGPIEATTTNGGVQVDLAAVADGGAKFGCTNGGLKVRLPADARATISASVTNGGIDVNGLQLESTQSTRRRLEARLNGGGPSIRIEGTNGGIEIARR
jgi:bifunctional DNA-binding transcriptional regulator/antitoxin component of YhaV-PrlF toxin-antitoxin module